MTALLGEVLPDRDSEISLFGTNVRAEGVIYGAARFTESVRQLCGHDNGDGSRDHLVVSPSLPWVIRKDPHGLRQAHRSSRSVSDNPGGGGGPGITGRRRRRTDELVVVGERFFLGEYVVVGEHLRRER